MPNSVEKIIDGLGGNEAAAELAGVVVSAVSNWKADGKIPARYFRLFSEVLEERGEGTPSPRCFAFKEAAE